MSINSRFSVLLNLAFFTLLVWFLSKVRLAQQCGADRFCTADTVADHSILAIVYLLWCVSMVLICEDFFDSYPEFLNK